MELRPLGMSREASNTSGSIETASSSSDRPTVRDYRRHSLRDSHRLIYNRRARTMPTPPRRRWFQFELLALVGTILRIIYVALATIVGGILGVVCLGMVILTILNGYD